MTEHSGSTLVIKSLMEEFSESRGPSLSSCRKTDGGCVAKSSGTNRIPCREVILVVQRQVTNTSSYSLRPAQTNITLITKVQKRHLKTVLNVISDQCGLFRLPMSTTLILPYSRRSWWKRACASLPVRKAHAWRADARLCVKLNGRGQPLAQAKSPRQLAIRPSMGTVTLSATSQTRKPLGGTHRANARPGFRHRHVRVSFLIHLLEVEQ